jgi:hypothetical protein
MYRNLAVIAIAGTLLASLGISKCVHRIIHVEGNIVSPASDRMIVRVEVTPDPNWEPQPEISVKGGKFAGEVYFDATKSEARVRDNCSRVPERVEVVLLKDRHEIGRVALDVQKAFAKDERHNYLLRSPITLHSQ